MQCAGMAHVAGNFVIFGSESAVDKLAHDVARAIDPTIDTALVGSTSPQAMYVVGRNTKSSLWELVPFAKKL